MACEEGGLLRVVGSAEDIEATGGAILTELETAGRIMEELGAILGSIDLVEEDAGNKGYIVEGATEYEE